MRIYSAARSLRLTKSIPKQIVEQTVAFNNIMPSLFCIECVNSSVMYVLSKSMLALCIKTPIVKYLSLAFLSMGLVLYAPTPK